MKLNPKYTTKDLVKGDISSYVSKMSTAKKVAVAGAGAGIVKAFVDDKDDNLVSTAGNALVGAGVSTGGYYGIKFAIGKLDDQSASSVTSQKVKEGNKLQREGSRIKAEAESSKIARQDGKHKMLTVSKVEKERIKASHDRMMKSESQKKVNKRTEAKMYSWLGKTKMAGAIGLGAFALASVMDTSQTLEENKQVSRMTNEQERNLAKKLKREEKNQSKQAYGHVDFGEMAFELFNERTGHYKMGNAKFQ